MEQTRQKAKKELLGAKKYMTAMLSEKKKGISFKGREIQFDIDGITRRVAYYSAGEKTAPVYFDIHGGGFAWGTVYDGDEWCDLIARKLGYHVFSLDYPLTPETEYPGQLEYLYDSILYICDHADEYGIDPASPVIGGRSAGGNLAAALCFYGIIRKEISFKAQILDHPWLDLAGSIAWDTRYKDESALPEGLMKMLALGYTDPDKWKEGTVSPICADSDLIKQLPGTIIQTAEMDSLEVEGRAYARLLEENGVPVVFRCADGAHHGFTEDYTLQGEEGRNWLLSAFRKIMEDK
jgi:acetyl esterase